MANVLIVEDDPVLSKNLQVNLQLDGYTVLWAKNRQQAREFLKSQSPDLMVLDLNLPDGHGFELLSEIRSTNRIPVIILTAMTDEDSVVEGIERGARDYVRKPFSYKELLVRMKAVLREPLFHEEQVRYGELIVLPASRVIRFKGGVINLNRREFDVLMALIERPETIVSRGQVLEKLDSAGEIFDRTIDAYISSIRSAFKKSGVVGIKISSVYGVGYRLEKV